MHQTVGENKKNYPVDADLGSTNNARKLRSLALAINDLRNANLKTKLMTKGGLGWADKNFQNQVKGNPDSGRPWRNHWGYNSYQKGGECSM